MKSSRTTKQKQSMESLGVVTIRLTPMPWTALQPDDPRLAGRIYLGPNQEEAFKNARADATRFYKNRADEVILEVVDG
jgi:hypothetical protein